MRAKIYPVVLHVTLIGFAAATLGLVQQNRDLRANLGGKSGLTIGSTAEPIDAQTLDSQPRPLRWDNAEQDRLLFVFTTDCPACKVNQAAWRTLTTEIGPTTEMIGVSLDGTEATQDYRDAQALPFEVVAATDRDAFSAAYAVSSVPTTVHIGRDGRVRGVWLGVLSTDQQASVVSSVRGQSNSFWPRIASFLDRVGFSAPSS